MDRLTHRHRQQCSHHHREKGVGVGGGGQIGEIEGGNDTLPGAIGTWCSVQMMLC